jgi:hypothetical protein
MGRLARLQKSLNFTIILAGSMIGPQLFGDHNLPLPDESRAALTIERSLYGAYVGSDFLFVFSGKSDHFVRMPLKSNAVDRETRFGKMTDHQRISIEGSRYPGDWRGAFQSGDRFVLLDASMLQLLSIRSKDYKSVMSSTVPADLLKPAADRAGEPTTLEIQRTRKQFANASRKIFGNRYVGFAEIPDSWKKGDTRDFLVASRIPGFPLLIMSCQKSDQMSCMISRQCFVAGGPRIDAKNLVGVAVDPATRRVFIGDAKTQSIRIFHFNSCFDIVYQKSLNLPKRLPKISNFSIDSTKRLWVTTETPDSFTDSNLFYWDSEQWDPKLSHAPK